MDGADVSVRDVNPLCGDVIEIYLKVDNGKIADVSFTGSGCAISQAAASMLTELVKGKALDDIKKLAKDDVLGLLGIDVSYSRMKCALLGLKTVKVAAYKYSGEKMSDEESRNL
jgi:nitrogen fixation NifU-like protein